MAIGQCAIVFVLPLFLVNAMGLTMIGAGLVLAGMALGALISGAAARHLVALVNEPGLTPRVHGLPP